MKIFITGGAGYKGVLLTEKLLERGHSVTVFDNFIYGTEPFMYLVGNKNLTVVKGDVRNLVKEDIKGFDVIYHLAGIGGLPGCEANPSSAQSINADASANLAKIADPKQLIIYAGTTSVYGNQMGKVCSETTPVALSSVYSKTKFAGEEALMKRKNTISLRFATIFGVAPRMRTDLLVNSFCQKAVDERVIVLSQGSSKRTFLHVVDSIQAYLLALDKADKMKGQIYNVGSDTLNYTKMEIAEHIAKYSPCKIVNTDIEGYDIRNFNINFDKIKKLGFKPTMTLDAGVEEMIKLYKYYKPFIDFRYI
jgi:nucleoside-diphosphate-sugar epimerase